MDKVAFDIEIAAESLDEDRLGVTCAAAGWIEKVWVWSGPRIGDRYLDQMTPTNVDQFISFLWNCHKSGRKIVAWNGAGFDFKVLAQECVNGLGKIRCKVMAANSYDPMFQFFCDKGYAVGLAAAAGGLGVEGKTEGMSGEQAPILWKGSLEDQETVRKYVAQDVRATAAVFDALEASGKLAWITKKGTPAKYPWKFGRLMTVKECYQTPVPPSPSWLDEPWEREKFVGWLDAEGWYTVNATKNTVEHGIEGMFGRIKYTEDGKLYVDVYGENGISGPYLLHEPEISPVVLLGG